MPRPRGPTHHQLGTSHRRNIRSRWSRGNSRGPCYSCYRPSLKHETTAYIELYMLHVVKRLENKRLKRFGHCLRREPKHICAKPLRLEVSRRRSRGGPNKRRRDNIKEDMKKYQLTEDMEQVRKYWMTKIMAGPIQGDGQER